jgi:hypothetical protein
VKTDHISYQWLHLPAVSNMQVHNIQNLEEGWGKDGGISTEEHLETQNWDYTSVLLPYHYL